jgi:hypothetical protein
VDPHCPAEPCLSLHQFSSLSKQVAAVIGSFDLVADAMRQCSLRDLSWKGSCAPPLNSKSSAEAVRGQIAPAHPLQHRHVRQMLAPFPAGKMNSLSRLDCRRSRIPAAAPASGTLRSRRAFIRVAGTIHPTLSGPPCGFAIGCRGAEPRSAEEEAQNAARPFGSLLRRNRRQGGRSAFRPSGCRNGQDWWPPREAGLRP